MRAFTKMTVEDWEKIVAKAAADVTAAEHDLGRKRDEHERTYFALTGLGDQLGIAKRRKAMKEAREKLDELREEYARTQRAHAEAVTREQHTDLEARWRKAEELAGALENQALIVQNKADELVREIEAFFKRGEELRTALPDASANELAQSMCNPSHAARLMQIYLYGKSGGKLPAGGLAQSPWTVMQGPDFSKRVRETVAMVLRHRPRTEPPEAA